MKVKRPIQISMYRNRLRQSRRAAEAYKNMPASGKPVMFARNSKYGIPYLSAWDRIKGMEALMVLQRKAREKKRYTMKTRRNVLKAFADQGQGGPLKNEYWNRELLSYV